MILLLAKAHSRLAAYLFALTGTNEYFLLHLRRAMSEAPLLLFTALAIYASYRLLMVLQGKALKKMFLWSVIAGFFSGMAGESKLTGLACAGIAILGTLVIISRPAHPSQIPRRYTLFMMPVIVLCTSLLFFFASYPFFYMNTVHRILTTFYVRGQVVDAQINRYDEQVIRPNERLNIIFQRVFRYPLAHHTNNMADMFFHWLNFIIAAFGLSYSIQQVWAKVKNQEIFIVLLAAALICAVPMSLVPFDWDRYYLYPIFFSCVFFTIGTSQLFFMGFSEFQNKGNLKLTARD